MTEVSGCSKNKSDLLSALLDPSWLRNHAIKFIRSGFGRGKSVDEIVSDATEFILTGYSLDRFDASKYPNVDPLQILKGHCAMSLHRHLRRAAKQESLRRKRTIAVEDFNTVQDQPESRIPNGRGGVLLSLLRMDGNPRAMKLVGILDQVRSGVSFLEAARRIGCRTEKEARWLVTWARKRYSAIGV